MDQYNTNIVLTEKDFDDIGLFDMYVRFKNNFIANELLVMCKNFSYGSRYCMIFLTNYGRFYSSEYEYDFTHGDSDSGRVVDIPNTDRYVELNFWISYNRINIIKSLYKDEYLGCGGEPYHPISTGFLNMLKLINNEKNYIEQQYKIIDDECRKNNNVSRKNRETALKIKSIINRLRIAKQKLEDNIVLSVDLDTI